MYFAKQTWETDTHTDLLSPSGLRKICAVTFTGKGQSIALEVKDASAYALRPSVDPDNIGRPHGTR